MDSLIIKRTAQENLSSDNKPQCSFDEEVLHWISNNCPGWNNEGIEKTYMIPPTFPDIPEQETKGDLTEKHVFDILEKFGNKTKQPMFVVHSHSFFELFQKLENGIVKNSDSHYLRGEADFVIIHRKLGVIFLQVKAADDAAGVSVFKYKEAEDQLNKDQIALTIALKRLGVNELDRKEEEKNKQLGPQDPERKTEAKTKPSRKKLKKSIEAEMNVYPGFVVMPNCSRNKAGKRRGCFREDILSVEDFERWWEENIQRTGEFSQDIYELMAIRFVGPRVLNESCLMKDVIDRTHKRLIMLTKSQLSIMTQDVPKQDIVGPAGSGKTWLLLEKAKQLAGKLKENERILIMCFNKPLSVYLTTEFQNFPKSKVVIKTFVSMLMQIKKEKIDLDRLTDEEKWKFVSERVQKLKSMQANSDPTYKDYTYEHVFVDEGQDMFGEWTDLIELLKLLHADSDEERRYRWVFFDNNQSVHSQNNIPEKIINNAKQMTEIVRNTWNIFQCSQKFLSPTMGAKLGHGIVGLPVKWIDRLPSSSNTPSEQLQKGAELVIRYIPHLDSESVAMSDIVVLTNNRKERDEVCSVFMSNDILTQNAEEAILSPDNAITVDSIRRFKGLERKVVILLDPPIDDDIEWRKVDVEVNYVAMSRCFCLLVIVTSREKKQKYEEFTLELAEGGH